jgi:hypothetical protein
MTGFDWAEFEKLFVRTGYGDGADSWMRFFAALPSFLRASRMTTSHPLNVSEAGWLDESLPIVKSRFLGQTAPSE